MRSVSAILLILVFVLNGLQGQTNSISGTSVTGMKNITRQDTAREFRKRNALTAADPDTNFTYEKYASFLKKVSDTSKYVVLPINEFRTTIKSNKIVIGLRHDVDNDLNKAFDFSATESDLGFRSTYYILHTAAYYLVNPSNMAVHTTSILPTLLTMQNQRNFEIGWHNDLVTLQAVYNIDPATFLGSELAWLSGNGINIYGSASHGSPYCYTYKYLNYYFFEECTYPVVGQFTNNLSLPLGGKNVPMKKGKFSDFGLQYEAYFLNNNKYFSDASITNGIRWNIGMLDISQLKPGDRVIILLHPIHWHRASVLANFEYFHIGEQISSVIDKAKQTVTVTMPDGTDRSSLIPFYSLSPGAYVKKEGSMQTSGLSNIDFSLPVIYTVYSENRDVKRDWTVKVVWQNPTSVEPEPAKEKLLVYPNPSDGLFSLEFTNQTAPDTKVEIFNSLGMKVYTERIRKSGTFIATIDLRSLPAGTYYLKYTGSKQTYSLILKPH
jgi:hypothetical protein